MGRGPIGIAAEIRGALANPFAGLSCGLAFGTIEAVNTGPPLTVNVYLNNSAGGAQASPTPNLPVSSGYMPVVNDAVYLLVGQGGLRTSYIVCGTVAGAGLGSVGLPIGAIVMFPTTLTSPIWLLCNGGTFSAATYPALNAFLGGNTLPNLVNQLPMGAGSVVALGASAGATTHVLTQSEMPSHTHPPGGGGSTFVEGTAGSTAVGSGSGGTAANATGSTGGGNAHSILNPVLGVAYYIKAL